MEALNYHRREKYFSRKADNPEPLAVDSAPDPTAPVEYLELRGGFGGRSEGRAGGLRYTGELSLASVGREAYSTKGAFLSLRERAGREAHSTQRSAF